MNLLWFCLLNDTCSSEAWRCSKYLVTCPKCVGSCLMKKMSWQRHFKKSRRTWKKSMVSASLEVFDSEVMRFIALFACLLKKLKAGESGNSFANASYPDADWTDRWPDLYYLFLSEGEPNLLFVFVHNNRSISGKKKENGWTSDQILDARQPEPKPLTIFKPATCYSMCKFHAHFKAWRNSEWIFGAEWFEVKAFVTPFL